MFENGGSDEECEDDMEGDALIRCKYQFFNTK